MGSMPPHFLSISKTGRQYHIVEFTWGQCRLISFPLAATEESDRDNLYIVKFTWGQCCLIFFPLAAAERARERQTIFHIVFPHLFEINCNTHSGPPAVDNWCGVAALQHKGEGYPMVDFLIHIPHI